MKLSIYKDWNPAIFGNDLKYWHKGDDKGITSSAGKILSIPNLGSIGGVFEQTTSANRPANSLHGDRMLSSVSFDGSDDYMDHDGYLSDWTFLHDGYTQWFWAGAVKANSVTTSRMLTGTYDGNNAFAGMNVFYEAANRRLRLRIGDGAGGVVIATSTPVDSFIFGVTYTVIIAVNYGGSPECQIWLDGVSLGTYAFTGTPTSDDPRYTMRLGHFISWDGDLPEGFIATKWPNNDDISRIHNYLKDRWHEWNPLDLGDKLKLWLNADNGITKDGDGYVSAWADLSDNGFDAVQATASDQPIMSTITGGLSALDFDGTDDWLDLNGISVPSGKHTIAFSIETSSANYIFDSETGRFVLQSRRTTGNALYNDGVWKEVGTTTSALQSLIFQLDSATASRFLVDGATNGTVTYVDTAIGARTGLGATYTGTAAWWTGLMRECIIVHPACTEEELARLLLWQQRNSGTP